MKTTIEIPEPLFRKAQNLSKKKNITFKSLVEEGLRIVLQNYNLKREKIEITPFVFTGGIKKDISWAEIQEQLDRDEVDRVKK